ncbi:hypothetical protein, partial [Arthrobacter sp. B10-11]|uniref:hypothetical protein n=1 Tax=Arthrobacter sp. B10-11 TaxID=3081160 RepID=UPI002955B15E
QPINKTIGINKLGTLLSSQTTDTPGTTTTNIQPVAARSGATSQTYLNSRLKANQRFRDLPVIETIPAFEPHAKWRTVFRLFRRGFGRLR